LVGLALPLRRARLIVKSACGDPDFSASVCRASIAHSRPTRPIEFVEVQYRPGFRAASGMVEPIILGKGKNPRSNSPYPGMQREEEDLEEVILHSPATTLVDEPKQNTLQKKVD